MYIKVVTYTNLNGEEKRARHKFYLMERDVFRNLVDLKALFDWKDSIQSEEPRDLVVEEVQEFYSNLESVLLNAYGIPSDDGETMDRSGRWDFENSAAFNQIMVDFLSKPQSAMEALDKMLPDGMDKMVRAADDSLAEAEKTAKDGDSQREIARLRLELARAKQIDQPTNS